MLNRALNHFKFHLERFILRGTLYRLLFIAVIIVLVSVAGGLLASWVSAGFDTSWDAIWWAFLRLTDPGYLGDDEGGLKRSVSTVLTILGYVLFMGALIAIMTQWLHETIERLQSGLTPIVESNHLLILGWTERTPIIVEQLLRSTGRVKRFLSMRGEKELQIVILAEAAGPAHLQTLRDHLGPLYKSRQITLRSGTPLQVEHLRRVDFLRTAAILLPAEDATDPHGGSTDGRVIKTLLSVANSSRHIKSGCLPLMVAEISDARNSTIAHRAYGGPIEILPGDQIISRLLAQNVRHLGLSYVFAEMFSTSGGNRIFIREANELAGQTFGALRHRFPQAILLGVSFPNHNGFQSVFNPPSDLEIKTDHRLILLAPSFADTEARTTTEPDTSSPSAASAVPEAPSSGTQRVLILGWNTQAAALIREFDSYENESFDITILSLLPAAKREALLHRHDAWPNRVQLHLVEGDYASISEVARLKPADFDHVVLLASDRLETDAESEARSILGYLILQEVLANAPRRPSILVELMTQENVALFRDRGDEVLVTPRVLSYVLTQVTLKRELRSALEVLFGPGGAEIYFRPVTDFADPSRPFTFHQIQHAAIERNEIALGFRLARERRDPGGGVRLNPTKDQTWQLTDQDEVVVIAGI